jgi:hypothetical protein
VNLTRLALDNYIAALVAVFMVILFGTISLSRLPVQLTPEVEKPTISVSTNWRAAAPEEIESEIIEPQEKVLRGLPGMTKLVSVAQRGRARITITLEIGGDLQRGLVEVLNRLNRVSSYPADADEPVTILLKTLCKPVLNGLQACQCPRFAAGVRARCVSLLIPTRPLTWVLSCPRSFGWLAPTRTSRPAALMWGNAAIPCVLAVRMT